MKKAFFVAIVLICAVLLMGCGGAEKEAEMQILGFAEKLTGNKYYPDSLTVKETGLAVDEVYYVVDGSVLYGENKEKSSLTGQVEYIKDEKLWKLVELKIDGDYIYTEDAAD